MFGKIIIASDLSEATNQVINCIQELKHLGTTEVILFHALGIKHLEALRYELARYSEPTLLEQKQLLEKLGFAADVNIGTDGVVWELNRTAAKENASLIVIGTHGRGMAFDALLGGEAHKIIHNAMFPLLIIRLQLFEGEGKCKANCLSLSKKILYATDFSDTAHRAFTYVEKMVECGAARISLLHVQDKTRIEKHLHHRLEEFNDIDTERLEMLKGILIKKGAREVDILLKYGFPVMEILKASKEDDYSVIVMGSQGKGYVKEMFLGSVSNNVIRHASLPVLLIPALR
jgi:nucleotide-binding universal stress UspA family protein